MKKTLLTFTILCSIITAHAQDLNGKFFAGGSLGFEATSASMGANSITYTNLNGYQSYSFLPSVGYYITNKVAVGLQLGYTSSTANYLEVYVNSGLYQNETYKMTNVTLSIAPLLRLTMPVTEKLGFNLNITLPYSNTKVTNSEQGSESLGITTGYMYITDNYTTNAFGLSISPGFQWFVKDNIAVLGSLGSLGYTHYMTTATANNYLPASTTTANDLRLSLTTGTTLGVTFYFGGSK